MTELIKKEDIERLKEGSLIQFEYKQFAGIHQFVGYFYKGNRLYKFFAGDFCLNMRKNKIGILDFGVMVIKSKNIVGEIKVLQDG